MKQRGKNNWSPIPLPPPPQNGANVHTDSVRTKACLQNSETCMRNLHWEVFVSQKCTRSFKLW